MVEKNRSNVEEPNSLQEQNGSGQKSSGEKPNAVEATAESILNGMNKIQGLIQRGEWAEVLSTLGAILIVFCLPGAPFSFLGEGLAELLSVDYTHLLLGTIFLLFASFLSLKAYRSVRKSTRKIRLSSVTLTVALCLAMCNFLLIKLSFLPDSPTNNISWGEQTLFAKHGPEATIYDSNRKALKDYSSFFRQPNLFHSPFKIAVALPISRKDGPLQSEEVLRGVAIAEKEWNSDKDHGNSKMVVAIADDGYSGTDSQSEIEAAKKSAYEITSDERVVGTIGHFSSAATKATADIYKKNEVVLVSPTSTAVRCSSEDSGGDCLDLNDYVFRTALSDDTITSDLINYLLYRESIRRVAIAYEEDDEYSHLYRKVFIENANQNVNNADESIEAIYTKESQYDECNITRDGFSAIACLNEAKSRNANALLLVPSTKNSPRVEELIRNNYDVVNEEGEKEYDFRLIGSDSMYQENFIEINGKAREETNGLLIPLSWHRKELKCRDSSDEIDSRLECRARKVFSQEYDHAVNDSSEYDPIPISWRTQTGYNAAISLFRAIDSSKKNCTVQTYIGRRSACIKKHLKTQLANEHIQNSTGEYVRFREGDRDELDSVIVKATNVDDSEGAIFSKQ